MRHHPCFNPKAVELFDMTNALKGLRYFFIILAIFISFISHSAYALPTDLQNFEVFNGGFVDIQDGAYVEGSSDQGGIQPNYKIDLESEPLKSLMINSRTIGLLKIAYWDKVGMILELLNQDFFKYTDYKNPYYRRLLKKYRESNSDIPLSEYGACGAGVCREHALVLHFALKAANIKNKHAYAAIYRSSHYHKFEIHEDHAFTVVEHNGEKWVVDAYYWGFNGYRLKDLMSAEGITKYSPQAPIAELGAGTRRILAINKFPKIYNPRIKIKRCSNYF